MRQFSDAALSERGLAVVLIFSKYFSDIEIYRLSRNTRRRFFSFLHSTVKAITTCLPVLIRRRRQQQQQRGSCHQCRFSWHENKNTSRVRVHEDIEREKRGVVFLFSFFLPLSIQGKTRSALFLFRIFFFCFHIESLFVRARIGHGSKYWEGARRKHFFSQTVLHNTHAHV